MKTARALALFLVFLPALAFAEAPDRYVIEGIKPIYQGRNECVPTVITMMLNFWGEDVDKEDVKRELFWNVNKGTSRTFAREYLAAKKGFRTESDSGSRVTINDVIENIAKGRPVIVAQWRSAELKKKALKSWQMTHWRIVYGYDTAERTFYIQDPQKNLGTCRIGFDEFVELWDLSDSEHRSKNWMLVFYKE